MKQSIKLIVLIIAVLFCSYSVYGQEKLTKEEKLARKWLKRGEQMGNGVVLVSLNGDVFTLYNDDYMKPTLNTQSLVLWSTANSQKVFLYCIPCENMASMCPRDVVSENEIPTNKGMAWLYNGGFSLKKNVKWSGKVENGLLEGKGCGFYNGDDNYIFCGEFHKGIPVGNLYSASPKGESYLKKENILKKALATPIVKVFPFNSGYARILENIGGTYRGAYINNRFERVMFLDGSFVESMFHNCWKDYKLVDFTDFKDSLATISFSYKYMNEEKPRGIIKMNIDTDLAFAGLSPESDKEITAILDRIIAAQINVLNSNDLKDPQKILKERGISVPDYVFCNTLKSILGHAYSTSKKYSVSEYNPKLIAVFPHLWKRFEMIDALSSIYDLISGQLVGYRIMLSEDASVGNLSNSQLDEGYIKRRLSEYMTKIYTLAPDPIFPPITEKGLQTLENEINNVNESFLSAYNDAKKQNEVALERIEAERRKASKRTYYYGSFSYNSDTEDTNNNSVDVENLSLPEYRIDSNWHKVTFSFLNQSCDETMFLTFKDTQEEAKIGRYKVKDKYVYHIFSTGWEYTSEEDAIIAAYAYQKYGAYRKKGKW